MRLFYAINFPKEVKDKLADLQNGLRRQLAAGRFTLYNNLHLTLVFIGEVPEHRAEALFDIADALRFEPFELCIESLGSFRRGGGHILWAGVRENDQLQALYNRLSGDVRAAGYNIEARRYTPHLTLVREAKFRQGDAPAALQAPAGPILTTVTKVSLMRSERLNGRLTYTESAEAGIKPHKTCLSGKPIPDRHNMRGKGAQSTWPKRTRGRKKGGGPPPVRIIRASRARTCRKCTIPMSGTGSTGRTGCGITFNGQRVKPASC